MRSTLISFWFGISGGWMQAIVPPSPLPGNAIPTYPQRALARPGQLPVEGDVAFTAVVNARGTVDSVSIVDVPWKELGFEGAVIEAVTGWRFTAGKADGNPIASTYVGKMRFVAPGELSFQSSRMFRRKSRDVWIRALQLLEFMKVPLESKDEDHQVLVSRPLTVDKNVIQRLGKIELTPWHPQGYALLQVFVSPYVEPARVHVGSVVIYTLGKANTWHINAGQVENLFLSALGESLGETGHPIPMSFIRRSELASRLDEDTVSSPCSSLQNSSDPIARTLLVMPPAAEVGAIPKEVDAPILVHHAADMMLRQRVRPVSLTASVAILEDGSVAGTVPSGDEPLRKDQQYLLSMGMLMTFRPLRYRDCFFPFSMKFQMIS